MIDEDWIAVALAMWGGKWLFGLLVQPRHDPSVISREWLRGCPLRPWELARALPWTELLGIGPLITLACLSSLVVLDAPGHGCGGGRRGGPAVSAHLGGQDDGSTGGLTAADPGRDDAGRRTDSDQLAASCAGCLPVAAWLLPRLGEGDMALVTPTTGRLPEPMIDMLTASSIGWGYG
ncbi:hypothetical protein [Streptomyces sp. NPDC059446]|uniref:hypothetical protein n=1 Tax=Streptomyces sp. NPDC059446 TaxID=3346833 RepID=UPI0036AC550F